MARSMTAPLAAAVLAAVCAAAFASSAQVQVAAPPPAQPASPAADAGRSTFEMLCSACHALKTVTAERHTRAEWDDEVHRMTERGMVATESQMTAVVDYLAKSLPPAP
jgi:cytochrome c5